MDLITIHTSADDPFIGYAESRIGGRAENQDSFSFAQTKMGFLVTVCDGMGGGPGGKTASSIAVREIIQTVADCSEEEKEAVDLIREAVLKANTAIFDAADDNPELKGMGSTATVLLLNKHAAIIAHVGDSRVYQLRGRQKVFRTFDHSVVFDMVRQNIITEEQARLSAQSNIITRALGVKPEVEVEIHEVPYEKGDIFMLCSDGIHGALPEKDLLTLLTDRRNSLGPVTDNIATTVDEIGRRDGGGHDNLTLAVIQTKNNSELKTNMPKRFRTLLSALCAVCALSLILNVVQCASKTPSTADNSNWEAKMVSMKTKYKALQDTLAIRDKEIKAQKDSLKKLNQAKAIKRIMQDNNQ